jgi:peptidyl-prolyl cis-trans isomerase C
MNERHSVHTRFPILLSILMIGCTATMAPSVWAKNGKAKEPSGEAEAVVARPFVTINREGQSTARAEVLMREQLARGAVDSPELRTGVRQMLISQAVMAQEARKAGLDKNPLLQAQIELAQQNLMAQAWQQKVLAENSIKDEEIKAEYELQRARMSEHDYQLRHLLVKDETVARLLTDKIKSGGKLADLTAEYSQDGQTRERGGLTDWTNGSAMQPALAEAVKPLAKGQVTAQPIKTEAGWHILQLEDRRPFQTLSLEKARPQIQMMLARRLLDSKIEALIKQAIVK